MAYSFKSYEDLADTFRHKWEQAKADADRIHNLIRLYEGRHNLPHSSRVNVESNTKQMGGVVYLRECLRGHQRERVAWETALAMLQAARKGGIR